MTASSPLRLASLDQFRGYTVAGMFFVNFSGGFAALHAVFKHHNTYCSYADTIMPQFFLAVGFALRLVILRNSERLGVWPAYRRALRRIALLIALGLVFYNIDFDRISLDALRHPQWPVLTKDHFWRDSFQTLVHIGITSLWVLPVIAASLRTRVIFAAASGLLHLALSAVFWYDLLHAKHVIDGGPLGFLTWTIPLVAGSAAYDFMKDSSPARAVYPVLRWGLGLMVAGYVLSCPAQGGGLAAPPFWPPHRPVDLWTMSQRAGSLSYLTFSAGWSLAVYALFVWMADVKGWSTRVFSILGQNALAAYLLHSFIEMAFDPFRHKDASLVQALGLAVLFIAVNVAIVAWLNRRGWFLRL